MDATRLRELAENLDRRYQAVKDFPERDPDAWMRMIELRNAVPDVVLALLAAAKAADDLVEIPEIRMGDFGKLVGVSRNN